jgi:hypothetical protein
MIEEEWGWFVIIDDDYKEENIKNNYNYKIYDDKSSVNTNNPQKYYITSFIIYVMSYFLKN